MNQEQNIEFNPQTVWNFRFWDADALLKLGAELSLSLSRGDLFLLREHFRLREGRDPIVAELQFLDRLAAYWKGLPETVLVGEIKGTEKEARVLADMEQKTASLPRTTPPAGLSLLQMMQTAGQYMARCGLAAHQKALTAAPAAELAAKGQGTPASPVLELGKTAALPLSPLPFPQNTAGMTLLLLCPTGERPFAEEAASFFAARRAMGLCPLVIPGEEGLLPHLLGLSNGFSVDISPLPACDPSREAAALLTAVGECLLFLAPTPAVPVLMSEADTPVRPFGQLTGDGRAQVYYGRQLLLSVGTDLLIALRHMRKVALTLPDTKAELLDYGITADETTCLGGITAQGGCDMPLLYLLYQMAAAGCDFQRVTLSALLEMPLKGEGAVAEAVPLLLDMHRVCTELALPAASHRIFLRGDIAKPRLTVYVAADTARPYIMTGWETAMAALDFAAMRTLLRPKCKAE